MVKDASELEAFYRFFQNEEIEASTVLEPHRRAAVARCNEVPVVRVAHDTTKFSFMGEREGLGLGGKGGGQGFQWDASLAISGDELRTPLGVLTASSFIDKERPEPIGLKKIKGRYETHPEVPPTPKIRREQKRSARWFQAVQEVEGLHSSARLIHVMDREADDFVLMAQMDGLGNRFVIRVKKTRRLGEDLSYDIEDRLQCARPRLFRTVPLSARKLPHVDPRMRKFRTHQPRDEREATLGADLAD